MIGTPGGSRAGHATEEPRDPGPRALAGGWISLAAVAGFSAVALGAFGAHGLRERLDAAGLEIYRTAALYHLVHAVALLATVALHDRLRCPRATSLLFAFGIVLFSGSLYLLAVTGIRGLGAVTPFGGVLFLVGWASALLPRAQPPLRR